MNKKEVKIGDFLKRIKRPIELEDDKEYKLVTIKLHHNGVTLRVMKKGGEIKSKMFEVRAGDFILSGIDARNGAFGIVPEELDGAIVTNDFWYFEIDEDIIDKHFFLELTATDWFDDICTKGSDGTTQRIRLQKAKFFDQTINLPNRSEQDDLLAVFKSRKSLTERLGAHINNRLELIPLLHQQILQESVTGKLSEKWRKENPNIEPSEVMLEKIRTDRKNLAEQGKSKKQNQLPQISEEVIPFEIPNVWAWCKLGDLLSLLTDYHANGSYKILKENVEIKSSPDFAVMLRTTNFHEDSKHNYRYITEEAYNFLDKSKLYPGDLIMNKIADPGRVFYVEDIGKPMSLAMNLFLLRFVPECNPKYIYYYLLSQYEYIYNFAKGTSTKTINKDSVNNILVALPPSDEQNFIVRKIEGLIDKTDKLNTNISTNLKGLDTLNGILLKQLFEK